MTENSFSSTLRQLSKDYYQRHISFEDYRDSRKLILQQIDEEFNGRSSEPVEQEIMQPEPSFFLKTISFFKNTDVTEKSKPE